MGQTKSTINLEDYIYEYQQNKDLSTRNFIVENYTHLVDIITSKIMRGYNTIYDREDIINEGIIGLIDAIERFDSKNNVKFETYASIRIKGAIIDFIRKQDIVPRRLRKLKKDIDFTYSCLYAQLCREPEKQEIIAHLNITEKEYEQAQLSACKTNILSIESLLCDDGIEFESEPTRQNKSEEILENKELISQLASCIENLKYREKMVISLYYVEEIKFKDIATLLNISQSRVCQIHTQALRKLRIKLNSYI